MAELTDPEAHELAGAFRPHRRPLLLAMVANLTLGVVFFGAPYARGRLLASEKRASFVAFERCLLGGRIADAPGLSLPRGEREHYAAQVIFAKADWPLSCRPTLLGLKPPEATFLWPSLKVAGLDLHAAVDVMDRELTQLSQRRKQTPGRVPARPLQGLQRLQAATVLYARAGGVTRDLDKDGVVLNDTVVAELATPARLPLMIGATQAMEAWSDAGALEVMALDTHSLAYLRVDNGKVDRQRLRRNSFLRGVVRADSTPFLVWAMPEARCAEQAEHCVNRSTGLARFDKGSTVLGEPTWKLPGHPAGRIDRALAISNSGRIDFLIHTNIAGGLELMRMRLPEAAMAGSAPGNAEPVTLLADEWWPVAEATNGASTTLIPGEPLAVLSASIDPANAENTVAELVTTAHPPVHLALPSAAGGGAWTLACNEGSSRFIAYGSDHELHVGALSIGMGNARDLQKAPNLSTQTTAIETPIHETDHTRDQVHLLCNAHGARLLYTDSAHVLWQMHCNDESCLPAREVARDVSQFDAVQRGDQTLLAFNAGPSSPTIRILRLDDLGVPAGAPEVVASCWEPLGGMCGTATLIAGAERAVLVARDGPDLLALETINAGYNFSTLSGFMTKSTDGRDTASPLQQHRKRKGIE